MSTDDPTPAPAHAGPPPTGPGFPPPAGTVPPAPTYPAAPTTAPYPAAPGDGAPGHGAPPAGPYGSPYGAPGGPVAPGTPGGGKGFAITALVLALVALVLSWVPFVNNLAAVLAVVGAVFGVIALVGAVRRGRPGKAMAISAVAVAVVALVVVVVTQIAYARVIDDVVDDLNDSVAELEQDTGASGAGDDDASPAAEDEPPAAAAAAAQDLAVLSVAFGQNEYDPTTWWYVAVVDNPNPEHVFPFAEFTVEAVGADGTILDSAPDYVDLLPGQTALTGVFLSVGDAPVDHVEVRGPQASEAVHETDLGTFAVADVAATSDEWSTTVGGTLTSAFAEDQELVTVVVVATAPDGTVLAGQMTYVDRLPAGGQARFEALFTSPLPADTIYTAFPRL